MSQRFIPLRPGLQRAVSALFGAIAMIGSAQAFDSGSTGADGALAPAVNTQIVLPPSGILNYTTINIPSGVTVTFKRNAANTPVVLLASGNVTIAGTLNVSGGHGADTAQYGDGNLADDGIPGVGGPGGFDGGRGGRLDAQNRASVVDGAAGQGPGGGQGARIATGAPYSTSVGTCRDNRINGYETYALGAGHSSAGPDAGYADYKCVGGSPAAPQYGSARLQTLIGGSGGGGARGTTGATGGGGGGGGGALLIASSGALSLTGVVNADGGDGGRMDNPYAAGGSGGAIRLTAGTVSGNGQLLARGGCSRYSTGSRTCNASQTGGAAGRIRIEADVITYNGSAQPTYSADSPGALALTGLPSVAFASIAGVAVPSEPTGAGDVVLPANVSNPVSVAFTTANVPLGSTIRLRVVPAQGLPIESTSSAVTGSLASGAATASVTLPQGPSRLEASATFSVTLAQGQALSRFAGNEAVREIEMHASPGGATRFIAMTDSGRRVVLSEGALRVAGIGG